MKTPPTLNTKLFIVFLFAVSFSVSAQVGINTTTPGDGSMLDVNSRDKGILIPRVSLTSLSTLAPVTVTAAAVESLLVYNDSDAVGAPSKGYYYWNGTDRWIPIAFKDADFFEVGTTEPPTEITQDVWRTGKVAIGKLTPDSPLDVYSEEGQNTVYIKRGGNDNTGTRGLVVENFNNGNKENVGLRVNIVSTDDSNSADRLTGQYIRVVNPGGTRETVGTYNITDAGSGNHTGMLNSLAGTETSINTGMGNYIYNTGNGVHYGISNQLKLKTGASGNTGSGDKYAVYNNIKDSKGNNYGVYTEVGGTIQDKISYGTYNRVFSSKGANVAGYFTTTDADPNPKPKDGKNYAAIFDKGRVVLKDVKNYADNSAAVSAGLEVGELYRTGDILKIVH